MDVVDKYIREYGALVGRGLIGLLFVFSGVGMLMSGVEGVAGMIASVGLPIPLLVAWVVVAVKIAAGTGLILGYKTRESSLALIAFVALTIVFFHSSVEDINMFKNLAIIGGLFYVYIYGPGPGWRLKVDRSASRSEDGPSMAI